MKGVHLRIYTHESSRHEGALLYEWLLEQARTLGIPGGSVFRAMAGYGRHGVLHESNFFELAGTEPVLVEFIAQPEQADALLDRLQTAGIQVFYARLEADFGIVGMK
ncbi:DUF190 domain-containing protein [Thermomonas hydrothermalis]|uniref:PII-like signaling protein n=1 Tax=Thermomonas hydrothermalis TaxID=213588 RepID=A0A1M4TY35_9GAMM|nr:DUF190 domain-containing protein [Thermomonas hydrothermalis]MCL6620027.1 DUF190 domain-containing protein [Thermomonas hydrothermalis]SHE49348.1 PII-like signaling protein [Thermomonas hydrothermalis]